MILLNLVGLSLIGLIIWWFWLYQPNKTLNSDTLKPIIVANGVYDPARVVIKAGKETRLSFVRKDASPCAGTLVFPELDISEELVLGKVKSIQLPKLEPGSYIFGCQMHMYRGELVVK